VALCHEKKEDIILLLMAGDYITKRILGVVLKTSEEEEQPHEVVSDE